MINFYKLFAKVVQSLFGIIMKINHYFKKMIHFLKI